MIDYKRIPPVTRFIITTCALVWLMTLLLPRVEEPLLRYLGLHYWGGPDFNPAQLFTYMFLHGGFVHLLFNMVTLYSFGWGIERTLGSGRFLFYYVACGIGAALIQEGIMAWQVADAVSSVDPALMAEVKEYLSQGSVLKYPPAPLQEYYALMLGVTVGASGAIFGLLLAVAVLFPNARMYLMFIPAPIKAKWAVLVFCLIELAFGVTGTLPGVAHFAHLGGALVGFIIIWIWKKKGKVHGSVY